MSKNRPSKAARKIAALNQIGSMILTLTQTYPKQAARYRKAADEVTQWGAYPVGHSCYRLACKWHERALSEAATWRDQCDKRQDELSKLARLVAFALPSLAGTLLAVRLHAIPWHEKPADEWGPLLEELGRIEAAAIHEAGVIDDSKPKGKRGRRPLSTEDLRERVKYASDYGTQAACDKFSCSSSAVSQWRRRLRAEGINPDQLN